MKENIEEDIIKKIGNPQNVDLITLLRQFKREGIENFIVLRKNNFDNILSDYKRVLKENEKLERANKCYINSIHSIVPVLNQDYIEKQKIKDKIEELEEKRIKMEKDDIGVGFTLGEEWSDLKSKIKAYKELLEEKGE